MVERVQRVARVSKVRYDEESPFARRRKEDGEQKDGFSHMLNEEQERRKEQLAQRAAERESAYNLNLSRPTQSLFYTGQAKIKWADGLPHAAETP